MKMDVLLSSLEEFFDLKREIGDSGEIEQLQAAQERAGKALNEYINNKFNVLMLEERRTSVRPSPYLPNGTPTRKVEVVDESTAQTETVSLGAVVELLAALSNAPTPLTNLSNPGTVANFFRAYKQWFENTRKDSIKNAASFQKIDLDLNEK